MCLYFTDAFFSKSEQVQNLTPKGTKVNTSDTSEELPTSLQ